MNKISSEHLLTLIKNPLMNIGYNIVKLSVKNSDPKIVELLIEKINNEPLSIKDCSVVSKNIDIILTVEGIEREEYNLEVSSPGIERPLVTLEDYTRFIGSIIKIKLSNAINNTTKLEGKIIKVINDNIYLLINDQEMVVSFDSIKKANLVLTDEIFKKMLKK